MCIIFFFFFFFFLFLNCRTAWQHRRLGQVLTNDHWGHDPHSTILQPYWTGHMIWTDSSNILHQLLYRVPMQCHKKSAPLKEVIQGLHQSLSNILASLQNSWNLVPRIEQSGILWKDSIHQCWTHRMRLTQQFQRKKTDLNSSSKYKYSFPPVSPVPLLYTPESD